MLGWVCRHRYLLAAHQHTTKTQLTDFPKAVLLLSASSRLQPPESQCSATVTLLETLILQHTHSWEKHSASVSQSDLALSADERRAAISKHFSRLGPSKPSHFPLKPFSGSIPWNQIKPLRPQIHPEMKTVNEASSMKQLKDEKEMQSNIVTNLTPHEFHQSLCHLTMQHGSLNKEKLNTKSPI